MPPVDQGGLLPGSENFGLGEMEKQEKNEERDRERERVEGGRERTATVWNTFFQESEQRPEGVWMGAVFVKANHVGDVGAKSYTGRETLTGRERE